MSDHQSACCAAPRPTTATREAPPEHDDALDSEREASADGMAAPVPPDTARTLDSNSISQFVKVQNPSSNSNTAPKEDVEIILFGKDPGNDGPLSFSPRQAVTDFIPGVSSNG